MANQRSPLHPSNASTDEERAETILEAFTSETGQVFDMLKAGLVEEASMRTIEVNVARDVILANIENVRGEAYGDAADSARIFAANCTAAAGHFSSAHHRTMIRAVAELFEQYAQIMEARAGMDDRPAAAPTPPPSPARTAAAVTAAESALEEDDAESEAEEEAGNLVNLTNRTAVDRRN